MVLNVVVMVQVVRQNATAQYINSFNIVSNDMYPVEYHAYSVANGIYLVDNEIDPAGMIIFYAI